MAGVGPIDTNGGNDVDGSEAANVDKTVVCSEDVPSFGTRASWAKRLPRKRPVPLLLTGLICVLGAGLVGTYLFVLLRRPQAVVASSSSPPSGVRDGGQTVSSVSPGLHGTQCAAIAVLEPMRRVVLDETFETVPLPRFKYEGQVQLNWSPGQTTFKPTTEEQSLVYPAEMGPVADLTARLTFEPLDKPAASGDTSLGVVLPQQVVFVVLRRRRSGEATNGEIRLVRGSMMEERTLRVFPFPNDLPNGDWTVRYHHGLIRVEHERRLVAQGFAYASPNTSPVIGAYVGQKGSGLTVKRIRISAADTPSLSSETMKILERAAATSKKSKELYHQKNYVESLVVAQETLRLFQKARGKVHPDVGNAWLNIALLQQAQGRSEDAQRSHETALAIFERSLGREHPITALQHAALAEVLSARGQLAAAEAELDKTAVTVRNVFGVEETKNK